MTRPFESAFPLSDLTFEERNRLESEVLPAVVDDPECAALTIVILEKQLAEARAERDARVPFTEGSADA